MPPKKIEQPSKDVPPQPQIIRCKDHQNSDGIYVMMPSTGNPYILCETCKKEKKYEKVNYFILKDVFYDALEAYRNINLPDNPLQYFAQYYHSQNFHLTEEEIDKQFDSFLEGIVNAIEKARDFTKVRLQQFKDYLAKNENKFKDPLNNIKYEHQELRTKLSQVNQNEKQTVLKFETSLQNFCDKIKTKVNRKEDFENDSTVQLTKGLREQQELFYNQNLLEDIQRRIEYLLIELQNGYIGKNSFFKSQIATDESILKVFQQIKQKGSIRDLISKTNLVYQKVNDDCFDDIKNQKQTIEKGTSLVLMQTKSGQKIGFYYNGLQRKKSLLFNLNKSIILMAQKDFQVEIPEPQVTDDQSPVIKIGKDLIIPGNLQNCKSQLGDIFDISDVNMKIFNKEEFLANGLEFDIDYFEIFQIKDPEILQDEPPRMTQPVNQFPLQQPIPNNPMGNQQPGQGLPPGVRQTVNNPPQMGQKFQPPFPPFPNGPK